MSKRSKACAFDRKTRQKIFERDGGCIFCQMWYHMPKEVVFELSILDTMHIINRSQGGLGVEKNGVCGCRYHHNLLDNGSKGLRPEMLNIIKSYMQRHYPDWDESSLVYKNGAF